MKKLIFVLLILFPSISYAQGSMSYETEWRGGSPLHTYGHMKYDNGILFRLKDSDGNALLKFDENGDTFYIGPNATPSLQVTLSTGNTIFGHGDDQDPTLTFDALANNGIFTWMSDEDRFLFSDDIHIPDNEKAYWGTDLDVNTYSSTAGVFYISTDGTNSLDATMRLVATNSGGNDRWGDLTFDIDEGYIFVGSDASGLWLQNGGQVLFDSSISSPNDEPYIYSSSTKQLDEVFDNIRFSSLTTDTDLTFAFNVFGTGSYDGVFAWDWDDDYFKFSDDVLMSSSENVYLGTTAHYLVGDGTDVTMLTSGNLVLGFDSTTLTFSDDVSSNQIVTGSSGDLYFAQDGTGTNDPRFFFGDILGNYSNSIIHNYDVYLIGAGFNGFRTETGLGMQLDVFTLPALDEGLIAGHPSDIFNPYFMMCAPTVAAGVYGGKQIIIGDGAGTDMFSVNALGDSSTYRDAYVGNDLVVTVDATILGNVGIGATPLPYTKLYATGTLDTETAKPGPPPIPFHVAGLEFAINNSTSQASAEDVLGFTGYARLVDGVGAYTGTVIGSYVVAEQSSETQDAPLLVGSRQAVSNDSDMDVDDATVYEANVSLTQNGDYTGDVIYFKVFEPLMPGTGDITGTLYGLKIPALTEGVTDNYGIYCETDSYFNAFVGIGETDPETAIHITGDDGYNGKLLFEVISDTVGTSGSISSRRARVGPLPPEEDDTLFAMQARGWDTVGYKLSGGFGFYAAADHAAGDTPGYFVVSTTPDGAQALVNRFIVPSDGGITINSETNHAGAGFNAIDIYHDDTDAWLTWDDGALKLDTSEATTTDVQIQYNTTDYANINVADSGVTTITTVDSDGAVGNLHLKPDGNTTIGDGGSANYTKIESDGTIEFVGNATVWDDLRIVPGSFDRPGVADPAIIPYDVNGGGVDTYLWEFAVDDVASFVVQLPHGYDQGENISVHVHWTPGPNGATENGNTVGWKVQYSWANIDGAFGNMTTADLSDACAGTDHLHQMTPEATITGTGKTMSSILICNITRTDTGADDTWTGTASTELPMILEIDFHFPMDTIGSRTSSTK